MLCVCECHARRAQRVSHAFIHSFIHSHPRVQSPPRGRRRRRRAVGGDLIPSSAFDDDSFDDYRSMREVRARAIATTFDFRLSTIDRRRRERRRERRPTFDARRTPSDVLRLYRLMAHDRRTIGAA